MFWILLLFLSTLRADHSIEKFKLCNKEECILIQCYFPVLEFLNATRSELQLFENFIERNHLFISYHLCDDLSVDKIDEVGACVYGVLFKLHQFDANGTIHQRIQTQSAQIQEQSVAVVFDMISTVLYRIRSIDNADQLDKAVLKSKEEEDVIVINAQALTPKVHLDVSRIVLNYGSWFTFLYSTSISTEETSCLYHLYPLDSNSTSPKCLREVDARMVLERQIGSRRDRSNVLRTVSDLTSVNVFPRILPTLFYIHHQSSSANTRSIPVDISNFSTSEIDDHVFLQGPYPFCLFWSGKKETFQRLGDDPSDELLDLLFEEEQEMDLINVYGMFDDEVRPIADSYPEIEPNPHILFLKNSTDYSQLRQRHAKLAVLFTVRWDSTSKLARRTFHRLASHLNRDLLMIEIDCFDWTDLCHAEMIFEWPTLVLFENEMVKEIYQGSTDEQEMGLFLLRFSVNQPYEVDTNSFIPQRITTVLARINDREKFLLDRYKSLVDMFMNNERIFFMFQYSAESSGLIIQQIFGDIQSSFQPKTSVHMLNDDVNYMKILITDALQTPIIPFDPMTFVKSSSNLFIAASRQQLHQVSSGNSLVWIDTNSPWILTINDYGHMRYPVVLYIDFSNGYVHVDSSLQDVDTWLSTVRMGSLEPFYILPSAEIDDRPSQKELDFIQQIDDEYHLIQQESERINEHGIGFDRNDRKSMPSDGSFGNSRIPPVISWWDEQSEEKSDNMHEELLKTSDRSLQRIFDDSLKLMSTDSTRKLRKRIHNCVYRKRVTGNFRTKDSFVGGHSKKSIDLSQNLIPINSNNLGHQLLEKIGWRPGSGLGVREDGIQTPIPIDVRNHKQGLGYDGNQWSDLLYHQIC